jgi:exonuclease III
MKYDPLNDLIHAIPTSRLLLQKAHEEGALIEGLCLYVSTIDALLRLAWVYSRNNALIQPESRQAFARLLAQGWTDAMRKVHPDGPLWTFWDYKFERWQKDKGMRLDHFLLSPNLSVRLVDGGVDRWARGQENASDHAPTWIML